MSDKPWKKYERDVAKAVGGQRRPVTGIDRGDGDVFTGDLELQCKYRLSQPPPGRLLDWLDGIRQAAVLRGRLGAVVWRRPGNKGVGESLVVMSLTDFQQLVDDLRSIDMGGPAQ